MVESQRGPLDDEDDDEDEHHLRRLPVTDTDPVVVRVAASVHCRPYAGAGAGDGCQDEGDDLEVGEDLTVATPVGVSRINMTPRS